MFSRRISIKKKSQNVWYSWFIALFLIVLIIWMGFVLVKTFVKYKEASASRNNSRKELAELIQKNQELEQKINHLSSDFGMDQELRNQYRVIKPGEEMLVIIQEENSDFSDQRSEIPENWFNKFIKFIGL